MVDSEYINDSYKIFKKINIGTITKISGIIRFVPDQFKTKQMCKHVKMLPFLNKICEIKLL